MRPLPENTLMLVDACKKAGVSVEAHLFPSGGHGLSLGTAETAWQGVNGIEPCVQVWPELAIAWMRRTFADTDAATTNFPKYVVSLDEFDMSRNGIKHRNIRDFLLEDSWA